MPDNGRRTAAPFLQRKKEIHWRNHDKESRNAKIAQNLQNTRRVGCQPDIDLLKLKKGKSLEQSVETYVHLLRNGFKCKTDSRGYPTPENMSPLKLILEASEGFIPLWAKGTTLRWRFQRSSLEVFEEPESIRETVRELIGEALLAWGDAVPVKFSEQEDAWDFEVAVRNADDCDINGCTLASAFFPDAGRHTLNIYPKIFKRPKQDQIETVAHELGHVFGLRHFFAQTREKQYPSETYGTQAALSIMNYGKDCQLTDIDRKDLTTLYTQAWAGEITEINGTPIRLVTPFHTS